MGSFKKYQVGKEEKMQMNCAIPLIINKTLEMALSLLGMETCFAFINHNHLVCWQLSSHDFPSLPVFYLKVFLHPFETIQLD